MLSQTFLDLIFDIRTKHLFFSTLKQQNPPEWSCGSPPGGTLEPSRDLKTIPVPALRLGPGHRDFKKLPRDSNVPARLGATAMEGGCPCEGTSSAGWSAFPVWGHYKAKQIPAAGFCIVPPWFLLPTHCQSCWPPLSAHAWSRSAQQACSSGGRTFPTCLRSPGIFERMFPTKKGICLHNHNAAIKTRKLTLISRYHLILTPHSNVAHCPPVLIAKGGGSESRAAFNCRVSSAWEHNLIFITVTLWSFKANYSVANFSMRLVWCFLALLRPCIWGRNTTAARLYSFHCILSCGPDVSSCYDWCCYLWSLD